MKNKKLLLIATAAMGFVALGTAGVSTIAWYQSSSAGASAGTHDLTSQLAVENKTTSIGGIKVNMVPHTGYATSLVVTNRAGRTYYVDKESTPHEIMADDLTVGSGKKQAAMTFDVTITAVDSGSNAVDLTTALVKQVAGASGATYTVRATAGGAVKIHQSATSSLGTASSSSTVNFAAPASLANNVLGQDKEQYVDIMKIKFNTDGTITKYIDVGTWESGSTWAIGTVSEKAGCEAQQTAQFHYGLEVKNTTAEATPALAEETENTSKITPSLE